MNKSKRTSRVIKHSLRKRVTLSLSITLVIGFTIGFIYAQPQSEQSIPTYHAEIFFTLQDGRP
jgi:hypothetical protein